MGCLRQSRQNFPPTDCAFMSFQAMAASEFLPNLEFETSSRVTVRQAACMPWLARRCSVYMTRPQLRLCCWTPSKPRSGFGLSLPARLVWGREEGDPFPTDDHAEILCGARLPLGSGQYGIACLGPIESIYQ